MVASQGNLFENDVRLLDGVHPRHQFAAVAFLCLRPGPGVGAGHPVDGVSAGGPLHDSRYLRSILVFGAAKGNDVHGLHGLAHPAGVGGVSRSPCLS